MLTDLPEACHAAILQHLPARDLLHLGQTCKALRKVAHDPVLWHDIAVQNWGHHVPMTVRDGNWKTWCCHRMNFKDIRRSPYRLVQESYPDPWQHMTACVLCSRTSGSEAIRSVISQFFDKFPTPSHVLDAADGAPFDFLYPLGLQPQRSRAVQAIAEGFLGTDWACPSEFHGCGKFVADSWRIFCRGDLTGKGVEDSSLKSYVYWAAKAGSDAIPADTATPPTTRQRNRSTLKQPPASVRQPNNKTFRRMTRSSNESLKSVASMGSRRVTRSLEKRLQTAAIVKGQSRASNSRSRQSGVAGEQMKGQQPPMGSKQQRNTKASKEWKGSHAKAATSNNKPQATRRQQQLAQPQTIKGQVGTSKGQKRGLSQLTAAPASNKRARMMDSGKLAREWVSQ